MAPYSITKVLVNIGSDNGLLPEDTKPFPEPILSTGPLGTKFSDISTT